MPTSTARTADDIAETIRSLIDRLADAKLTQEMAKRGQDVAGILAERGAEVGDRASETWRDTRPIRRDAARRFARATDDASKWSSRTWRKSLRPALKDLWSQRAIAAGAAGAVVPAGRELVDTAAVRLGLRQRQEARHWGAFFLGILVGAAAGAIAALLTTPKRGEEMRRELGVRADEVRREVAQRADEIATKARDEWVPLFQGPETTNGHGAVADVDPFSDRAAVGLEADPFPEPPTTLTGGVAGSGTSTEPYGATDPMATIDVTTVEATGDATSGATADATGEPASEPAERDTTV